VTVVHERWARRLLYSVFARTRSPPLSFLPSMIVHKLRLWQSSTFSGFCFFQKCRSEATIRAKPQAAAGRAQSAASDERSARGATAACPRYLSGDDRNNPERDPQLGTRLGHPEGGIAPVASASGEFIALRASGAWLRPGVACRQEARARFVRRNTGATRRRQGPTHESCATSMASSQSLVGGFH